MSSPIQQQDVRMGGGNKKQETREIEACARGVEGSKVAKGSGLPNTHLPEGEPNLVSRVRPMMSTVSKWECLSNNNGVKGSHTSNASGTDFGQLGAGVLRPFGHSEARHQRLLPRGETAC